MAIIINVFWHFIDKLIKTRREKMQAERSPTNERRIVGIGNDLLKSLYMAYIIKRKLLGTAGRRVLTWPLM